MVRAPPVRWSIGLPYGGVSPLRFPASSLGPRGKPARRREVVRQRSHASFSCVAPRSGLSPRLSPYSATDAMGSVRSASWYPFGSVRRDRAVLLIEVQDGGVDSGGQLVDFARKRAVDMRAQTGQFVGRSVAMDDRRLSARLMADTRGGPRRSQFGSGTAYAGRIPGPLGPGRRRHPRA